MQDGSFMVTYIGKVQPQQRPRHRVVTAKNGRVFAQTYEARESRDFKATLHYLAQKELEESGQFMIEGACSIHVSVRVPIPKSLSAVKKKNIAEGHVRPERKPDVDNILKAVMDALTGVLYSDDKLVVYASVEKAYGPQEGVTVYVRPWR